MGKIAVVKTSDCEHPDEIEKNARTHRHRTDAHPEDRKATEM
jgi:hypothetical protein